MLGFAFITLHLIRGLQKTGAVRSLMQDLVGCTVIFFMGATIFAYLALRSGKRALFWERVADWLFLIGLAGTLADTIVLVFSIA